MRVLGRLRRCRKGIATIIGIAFFLLLFVASITTVFVMTNSLSEFQRSAQSSIEEATERAQERIEITSAHLDSTPGTSKHLVLNVTNRGSVPAVLTRLIILNATDNERQIFLLDDIVTAPGESITNTTKVSLATGKNYEIRVVTERGNIASFNLVASLRARIAVVAPSLIETNTNATVLVIIGNNDTSNNSLFELQPTLTVTPAGAALLKTGPTPAKVALLTPGSTAVFKYVFLVTGTAQSFTWTGSFVNAPSNIFDTADAQAKLGTGAQLTQTAGVINVRGGIPNPEDGTTSKFNNWALILSNLTNRTITVNGIAFSAVSQQLFRSPAFGIPIFPSSGWSVATTSESAIIFWTDADGFDISPGHAINFTVRALGANIRAIETDILLIATTSDGRITSTFTSSQDAAYPGMTLYLNSCCPEGVNRPKTWALSNETAVKETTTPKFNLTLENTGNSVLSSRSNLTIIVPIGWTNIAFPTGAGTDTSFWDVNNIKTISNDDGTTTIKVGSIPTSLAGGLTKLFVFEAQAPSVDNDTLYSFTSTVFYSGLTDPPAVASTLSEFVVTVENS